MLPLTNQLFPHWSIPLTAFYSVRVGVQAEQVSEGALRGSHVRSALSEFSGKDSATLFYKYFSLLLLSY